MESKDFRRSIISDSQCVRLTNAIARLLVLTSCVCCQVNTFLNLISCKKCSYFAVFQPASALHETSLQTQGSYILGGRRSRKRCRTLKRYLGVYGDLLCGSRSMITLAVGPLLPLFKQLATSIAIFTNTSSPSSESFILHSSEHSGDYCHCGDGGLRTVGSTVDVLLTDVSKK